MPRPLVLSLVALALLAPMALAARPPAPAAKPARSLLEDVELFSIDAPHSEIGFTVPWMGISRVRGSFERFRGSIAFDTRDITRSSIVVLIQANSIDTGFERRDKDLKGTAFFDVEKFPLITFTSREIVKQGAGWVARGPLTMHGVTKEIEIPFTYNGRIRDKMSDPRIGFEGRVTLNRKDYGIVGPPEMNALLDRGIIIGETVDIPLALEGWRASARETLEDRAADSVYRAVLARGVPAVAKQFREARAKTADSLLAANETVINEVGFQLLEFGRLEAARDVFRLEVEAWPASGFGWVGLGQAWAMLGDRDQAVASLEKAVAILPEAPRAQVILKRLRG